MSGRRGQRCEVCPYPTKLQRRSSEGADLNGTGAEGPKNTPVDCPQIDATGSGWGVGAAVSTASHRVTGDVVAYVVEPVVSVVLDHSPAYSI